MTREEAFASVPTMNAVNGKNGHASLRNVAGVDEQSIAAKNVRRMLGFTIGTGVKSQIHDKLLMELYDWRGALSYCCTPKTSSMVHWTSVMVAGATSY